MKKAISSYKAKTLREDAHSREGFAGEALCSEGFDVSMVRDGNLLAGIMK